MGISLNKVEQEAPELLSLAKGANDALAARDLTGLTAQVAIVLDFSYSMNHEYSSGAVQKLVDKALAFATQVDDDGEIDIFLFSTTTKYKGKASLSNFRTIVRDFTKGEDMAGTNYAPAIEAVVSQMTGTKRKGLFGRKKQATSTAETPALVLFVTDGEPQDRAESAKALADASGKPLFFQFLSLGRNIPFLASLDTLPGRVIDNAGYQNVPSISTLTDEQLFGQLLSEYPSWISEAKAAGIVK